MLDNNIIYLVILHIASTRDGRHLLYDIAVLKKEGVSLDTNATPHVTPSVRTSENRETDSQQAVKKLTSFKDKISRDNSAVKKNSVRYQVNQAAREQLRAQNAGAEIVEITSGEKAATDEETIFEEAEPETEHTE